MDDLETRIFIGTGEQLTFSFDKPVTPFPWQMTKREWERERLRWTYVRGPGYPHVTDIADVTPLRPADGGDRVMMPDGTIWEYKGISAYCADNLSRRCGWEDVSETVYRRVDHAIAVRQALAEGYPVPLDVLREWPGAVVRGVYG
jgi:hypothetical protein